MIDIGVNLADASFDPDRDAVLQRAKRAGVERIVVTGSSLAGSHAALALCRGEAAADRPRLAATAGLHPHHAEDWSADAAEGFAALLAEPAVVAGGECGLDYFRDLAPRPAQRRAFAGQLALAVRAGKPVFLHQREAHADFHAILREHRAALVGAVVHCFTDEGAALDAYLDLDCHIGITGWVCDERRGSHLLPLLPRIPATRLLLETDAPYLLPRTLRPKPRHRRNEPAYLGAVRDAVAAARGEDPAALAAQTAANARRFFGLPD